MTAKINIKNGDTFAVQASVSGVTIDNGIDKWQIKSQVRKPKTLELVADLSVNVIDYATYQLLCTNTDNWPVGLLYCDIQYTTLSGQKVSTETFNINVIQGITS